MYKGFCATIGSLNSLGLAMLGGVGMCAGVVGEITALCLMAGTFVGAAGMVAAAYVEEPTTNNLRMKKIGLTQGARIMKQRQLGAYLLTTLSLTAVFKASTQTHIFKEIKQRHETPLVPPSSAPVQKHAVYAP